MIDSVDRLEIHRIPFFFSNLFSKTLGIVSPVEDDSKDEASLAKDQIEQSRQRLVKLEEDGLEFVGIRLPSFVM